MTSHLLVNPAAGRSRALDLSIRVARLLGGDYKTHITSSIEHAKEIVADFGEDVTVAILGGDGTISSIADVAVKNGFTILPLPGGTGNDLCRSLGIGTDPIKAAIESPRFVSRRIDVIESDGVVRTCALSYGIIAQSARLSQTLPSFLPSNLQYLWGTARAMGTPARRVKITTDQGVILDGKTWLATFANAPFLGNGIKICPQASLDDGFLDFFWTDDVPRYRVVAATPLIIAGEMQRHPDMHHVRLKEATVEVFHDLASADGECFSPPSHVKVLPGALKILSAYKKTYG